MCIFLPHQNQFQLKGTSICPKIPKNMQVIEISDPKRSFFFSFFLLIAQVSTQYQPQLPNFLLTLIEFIMEIDKAQALRHKYLHYSIDCLLEKNSYELRDPWVYVDPHGEKHILIQQIETCSLFPKISHLNCQHSQLEPINFEEFPSIFYFPNHFHAKYLSQPELQNISVEKLVTLDQMRLKCQANCYFQPQELIFDFKRIIAWNQIYRAKCAESFCYLSFIFAEFVKLVNRVKLHQKFTEEKMNDFQRLFSCEEKFKVKAANWPVIPENFRQYSETPSYDPTPGNRKKYIEKKMTTKKLPVECPQNCVCLSNEEDKKFCRYTLKDGWVSQCPNRSNRIQCCHKNPEDMNKCRNSEIKKGMGKKCRKSEGIFCDQSEIEECVVWGIDLYTRNVIFNCLPLLDINFVTGINNQEQRHSFIQKALLKAMNFLQKDGYDLVKACSLIINQNDGLNTSTAANSDDNLHTLEKYIWKGSILHKKNNSNGQNGFFSEKDAFYASVLMKNYQMCDDKSAFRVHTKGKGAKCVNKEGIKEGDFIVQYFGEIYEPWRWYQREDFIKQIIKRNQNLKNLVPEFYNIYLETHKDDPEGYDLMIVDPNKKGNFASRFSHSCSPNCGTIATISNGKYYIGMYAFRDIEFGEQLTFDYCSMTESFQEHANSICLCGMKECRGNYLSLANSKMSNKVMDKNCCFLSRNSQVLSSLAPLTEFDEAVCAKYNVGAKMLSGVPGWLKKWTADILHSIEEQTEIYKKELIEQWREYYPWDDCENVRQKNIELYSQTYKQEFNSIRFQNLYMSIDKLKYYFESVGDDRPPIYQFDTNALVEMLITDKASVINQIQDVLIAEELQEEAKIVQAFIDRIEQVSKNNEKLFLFRLCCLCISHKCLFLKPTPKFNCLFFSDIIYFYAFTHTYFTATDYKMHASEFIEISHQEITGDKRDSKIERDRKKYYSQFVWGQLISWYKQTISNPESSLSQEKRGPISYPTIKSVILSKYPFDKHNRTSFHRTLCEKPSISWAAPHSSGCISFKNPNKMYGTVMFESVHSARKLKSISEKQTLLHTVISLIGKPFNQKLAYFQKVERKLSGYKQCFGEYEIVNEIWDNSEMFNKELPKAVKFSNIRQNCSHPRKKAHVDQNQDIM